MQHSFFKWNAKRGSSWLKRCCLLGILGLLLAPRLVVQAQSLELMPGDKRFFADLQWLKPLDQKYHWTVFSRTRITVDYENNSDLFSGAYGNYTTGVGIGASLVGKVAGSGAGADMGIHFFKSREQWTLFALLALGLKSSLEYSWFSIFRYTPPLRKHWKLYTSLELFSLFTGAGHRFSVQRLRVGLDWRNYQFGLANNLSLTGPRVSSRFNNFGVFLRRSF